MFLVNALQPIVRTVATTAATTMKKHGAVMLTFMGVATGILAFGETVNGTIEAVAILDKRKKEENVDKLPAVEVVKETWTCYIRPVAETALSMTCFIGSNVLSYKRAMAFMTAYTLEETALKEYKEKVKETIGEKKEAKIHDAIIEDKIESNPVETNEVIMTKKGDTLCCDTTFMRYFRSDIETIKQAVNKLNYRMMSEMYISLNDFYYELGLAACEGGDNIGWNMDNGLIELYYHSTLASDGTPCLAIEYSVAPRYDFGRLG